MIIKTWYKTDDELITHDFLRKIIAQIALPSGAGRFFVHGSSPSYFAPMKDNLGRYLILRHVIFPNADIVLTPKVDSAIR